MSHKQLIAPFKVGQTVATPDGRQGQILWYFDFDKSRTDAYVPRQVNVLIGKQAVGFPVGAIKESGNGITVNA